MSGTKQRNTVASLLFSTLSSPSQSDEAKNDMKGIQTEKEPSLLQTT